MKPRQRRSGPLLRLAGLLLLGFSAGCNFARGCTLIGCVNGLIVEFSAPATAPYRIEVRSNALTVNVYECTVLNQCYPHGAIFQEYFPGEVTIKVVTAAGTTTTSATPTYRESQPNGEGCGPTCRTARVTVPFPAG